MDASINNRKKEREKILSDAEDPIESIETTVKEHAKYKKLLTQNMRKSREDQI